MAMPPEAKKAFEGQRRNAKRRGIPFLFTPETWWAWWQEDDRWPKRGRRRDGLVMCRKGDVGPYSPENVYCSTLVGNFADVAPEVYLPAFRAGMAKAVREGRMRRPHLMVRGDGHPRSKAVVAPKGRFGSAA